MEGDHVADTHSLIWHLSQSNELSRIAKVILRDADAGHRVILVPSIALVEIVYLAERGRIDAGLLQQMMDYLADPDQSYRQVVLDKDIVRAMQRVPRLAVPDMPDRIFAATALHLRLPLISRDYRIRASGVVPVAW